MMTLGWQIIVVGLIVCAAALYVGRYLYRALRSFRRGSDATTCATGCGNCGDAGEPSPVKIKRALKS